MNRFIVKKLIYLVEREFIHLIEIKKLCRRHPKGKRYSMQRYISRFFAVMLHDIIDSRLTHAAHLCKPIIGDVSLLAELFNSFYNHFGMLHFNFDIKFHFSYLLFLKNFSFHMICLFFLDFKKQMKNIRFYPILLLLFDMRWTKERNETCFLQVYR